MQFEFGYNNTETLKYTIEALKRRNLYVDVFYTGSEIVNTGRLTGNCKTEDIIEQKKLIINSFPKSKLYVVLNDSVLLNFERQKTLSDIQKLVEEASIDGLIIANPILLYFYKDYFKEKKIDITISTITDINTVEKLEKLISDDLYFTGIVVPISINRDIESLRLMKELVGDRKITIIPNESCSPHCVNRPFHFTAHSIKNIDFSNVFVNECSADISNNPIKVLTSGMLTPSMIIDDYQQVVDIVKLPNRHLVNDTCIEKSIDRLDFYRQGKNPDDFFKLLGFDFSYSVKTESISTLFKVWNNCKNSCYRCNICLDFEKYIIKN